MCDIDRDLLIGAGQRQAGAPGLERADVLCDRGLPLVFARSGGSAALSMRHFGFGDRMQPDRLIYPAELEFT